MAASALTYIFLWIQWENTLKRDQRFYLKSVRMQHEFVSSFLLIIWQIYTICQNSNEINSECFYQIKWNLSVMLSPKIFPLNSFQIYFISRVFLGGNPVMSFWIPKSGIGTIGNSILVCDSIRHVSYEHIQNMSHALFTNRNLCCTNKLWAFYNFIVI